MIECKSIAHMRDCLEKLRDDTDNFLVCNDSTKCQPGDETWENAFEILHFAGIYYAVIDTEAKATVRSVLRECRSKAGLTQQQVSSLSGVSLRHYQRLESGESSFSDLTVKAALSLAEVLGTDVQTLADWERIYGGACSED